MLILNDNYQEIVRKTLLTLLSIAMVFSFTFQKKVKSFLILLVIQINSMNELGILIFTIVYILGIVLFIPGTFFIIAAGFFFGMEKGFLIVSLAATIGSLLALLLGRFIFKNEIEQKLRKDEKWVQINQKLEEKGWVLLILLRITPLYPASIGNYAFGTTKIPVKPYLLYSWIGSIPNFLFYLYLGVKANQLTVNNKLSIQYPWEIAIIVLWVVSTITIPFVIKKLFFQAVS